MRERNGCYCTLSQQGRGAPCVALCGLSDLPVAPILTAAAATSTRPAPGERAVGVGCNVCRRGGSNMARAPTAVTAIFVTTALTAAVAAWRARQKPRVDPVVRPVGVDPLWFGVAVRARAVWVVVVAGIYSARLSAVTRPFTAGSTTAAACGRDVGRGVMRCCWPRDE